MMNSVPEVSLEDPNNVTSGGSIFTTIIETLLSHTRRELSSESALMYHSPSTPDQDYLVNSHNHSSAWIDSLVATLGDADNYGNGTKGFGNIGNRSMVDSRPQPDSIISNPFVLFVSIASALGNLTILSVIFCTPKFRKPANLLIANLSLSSFLFILSSNLRLAENSIEMWAYSTPICKILAILHRIPVPMVALTTMIISLDRGRIARNPMTGSTSLSPIWKIMFIWSFSVIIVIPLGLTRLYDPCILGPYKCTKVLMLNSSTFSIIYGVAYLLSVHVVPAIILVQESIKTFTKMRFLKVAATIHSESFPVTPDNRLRLLRNSCIFSFIFLVFWLPYGILHFPFDMPPELVPDILLAYVKFYFKFFKNITYMQIALNPAILSLLSFDLIKAFSRIKWPFKITRSCRPERDYVEMNHI